MTQRTDTERLDWLEQQHFTLYRGRDWDGAPESKLDAHAVYVNEDKEPRRGILGEVAPFVRAAIDVAMDAASPASHPGGHGEKR